MPSLTVGEAAVRARSLSVRSYDIHLDLTRGASHFRSRTVIEFDSLDHQDTFVEIACAELIDVHLNRTRVDPDRLRDGRLPLSGLRAANTLIVDATIAYSHDGEGLHRAVDPEDKLVYVYAMAFLDNAARIFACFDQPDLKATFRLAVTAPADWALVSNGRASRLAEGEWTFRETPRMATYLLTLVAGPLHSVLSEYDGMQLGLHCRQSLATYLDQDAEELFQITKAAFDAYHRLFGIRYPFGDYHQAFVPEFNAGAMENPGCVTFRDELVFKAEATAIERAVRAEIVAHELAHMWFGDLVTMTWWDDLWLNESFADYMGYQVTAEATRFDEIRAEFGLIRKAWGMAADQRSTTHPIAGNGVTDARSALSDFDGISYAKGAAVLGQLNTYLGDEYFIGGVVDHLQRHSYGNATLADLLESWERVSGADVRGWADAWLQVAGIDTLRCRIGESGPELVRVNGSVDSEATRPHAVTVSHVRDDGGLTSTQVVIDSEVLPIDLPSYDGRGLILPDSGDQTWAKIGLDRDSVDQAGPLLTRISEPVARIALWGAVREGVLDGQISPDTYLDILQTALPGESDIAVESILKRSVYGWLGTYLMVPGDASRLAALATRVLADSTPGSNRQLVTARALIDVTTDVGLLRRWHEGRAPEGIKVDDDFRWRVLRALAVNGEVDTDDIAEGERRDPSSQGVLHALRCTASLPQSQSKAAVWERLINDRELTNYEAFALAEHFFQAVQTGVTAEYVDRYFAEIPGTSAFRHGLMAEQVAGFVFPRFAMDSSTVAAASACLAGDLDHGVRRAITDGADDLKRLLRARARLTGSALDD